MNRVKIKIPNENPLFSTKIPIRITDINYGGHVGNDSILAILHEARMQFLHAFGYSELDAGGNSLIMADVMIAYKNESFYGDLLQISIFSDCIATKAFDLIYKVEKLKDENKITVALAKTGMVCFAYETRTIAEMKPELKWLLEGNKM